MQLHCVLLLFWLWFSVCVCKQSIHKALSSRDKCVATQTYTYACRQLYPCSSVVTFISIQLHIWLSCHNGSVCMGVPACYMEYWCALLSIPLRITSKQKERRYGGRSFTIFICVDPQIIWYTFTTIHCRCHTTQWTITSWSFTNITWAGGLLLPWYSDQELVVRLWVWYCF